MSEWVPAPEAARRLGLSATTTVYGPSYRRRFKFRKRNGKVEILLPNGEAKDADPRPKIAVHAEPLDAVIAALREKRDEIDHLIATLDTILGQRA